MQAHNKLVTTKNNTLLTREKKKTKRLPKISNHNKKKVENLNFVHQ